jgi:hypothetical protein
MKLLRKTIRRLILEDSSTAVQAFVAELSPQVTSHSFDGYVLELEMAHPGGCFLFLDMTIEGANEVYLNTMNVGPSETCARRGYAREMLERVIAAADSNNITLELLSATGGMISDEDLMQFYSRLGFKVIEDIGGSYEMRRLPLNNRGQQ